MSSVIADYEAAELTSMRRRTFRNLAEYLHSIGSVPLERVLLAAPFGLALESDVVWLIAQHKRYCELIDGTLVEKPVGSFEDLIATVLSAKLTAFVESADLGIVTGSGCIIRVAPEQVRIPDVAYFSNERIPFGEALTDAVWDIAPDLAVEVISTGNTRDEMTRKLREYFAAGVKLIWFIYPKSRTAEVFKGNMVEPFLLVGASDDLDGDEVLPGFKLPIKTLFKAIDRKQRKS